MALQQANSISNQTYSTRRQALTQFVNRTGQRLGDFLLNQWASVITAILGLLVFAALSVPFLSYFGLDGISKQIFYSLHVVCAQIPSHSFYIFGHQLGMCARNFSIYTSMFIGSLIFVLSKKRLPGIPWWIWVLMILPMAVDGTTQMFGWRESTWELRVLTGTLFGLGNVWFALPFIQKVILESLSLQQQASSQQWQPSPGNIAVYSDAARTEVIPANGTSHSEEHEIVSN